ncbi:MAG: hypothetical protein KZQ61_06790, partial [Candidatus Thiodiazotropha sp. (ex Lucinoma aequizonata)]|nr:hypothetical protein [Candidatus Thiodiazotropha sp. (ex Lucinoma aequizonata)]
QSNGTDVLLAYLQLWVDHFAHGDFTGRRFMGFVVFVALQDYTLIRGCWSYALKTISYQIGGVYCFLLPLYSSMP